MRTLWFAAALAMSATPALRSEIHDVLKNAEIQDDLAKVKGSLTIHQRPNFSISLHSQEPGGPELHRELCDLQRPRRSVGGAPGLRGYLLLEDGNRRRPDRRANSRREGGIAGRTPWLWRDQRTAA